MQLHKAEVTFADRDFGPLAFDTRFLLWLSGALFGVKGIGCLLLGVCVPFLNVLVEPLPSTSVCPLSRSYCYQPGQNRLTVSPDPSIKITPLSSSTHGSSELRPSLLMRSTWKAMRALTKSPIAEPNHPDTKATAASLHHSPLTPAAPLMISTPLRH